jgi:hypothetical protein
MADGRCAKKFGLDLNVGFVQVITRYVWAFITRYGFRVYPSPHTEKCPPPQGAQMRVTSLLLSAQQHLNIIMLCLSNMKLNISNIKLEINNGVKS